MHMTAMLVHNTLGAMMITGSHVPPARLHTIKTAVHPLAAQERRAKGEPPCHDEWCQDR